MSDSRAGGVPENSIGTNRGASTGSDQEAQKGVDCRLEEHRPPAARDGDAQAAIEAFIRRHGVTHCPTAHARGGRRSVLLGGIYL